MQTLYSMDLTSLRADRDVQTGQCAIISTFKSVVISPIDSFDGKGS